MSTKPTYIPGVCNIGPAEIKLRRSAGIIGLAATIVFWLLFVWLDVPALLRLTLFLPATLAAVGFLQAWLHFCVKYGMNGLFNVSDGMASQESVDKKEFRRKDQQKAVLIIVGSLFFGIAIAITAYALT